MKRYFESLRPADVSAVHRIEAAEFLPHSGIRFPQNPCTSCPYSASVWDGRI